MTCSIFIASTTATCWPWRTASPSFTSIATMVPWMGDATPTEPSGPARSGASSSTCVCAAAPPSSPHRARTAPADRCSSRSRRRSPRRVTQPVRPARSAAAARHSRRATPCAHRASACARRRLAKSGCARMLRRKRDVGGDALEAEFARARARRAPRRRAKSGDGECDDHLRQQRVERARGAVAGIAEPVGAHAGAGRRLVDGERAAAGPHRAVGPIVSMLTRAWIA